MLSLRAQLALNTLVSHTISVALAGSCNGCIVKTPGEKWSLVGMIYFVVWTREHQLNGLLIDWLSKEHAFEGNTTFKISIGQEGKEQAEAFEVYSHQTNYQRHSMHVRLITVNWKGCGVLKENKKVSKWGQKLQTLRIINGDSKSCLSSSYKTPYILDYGLKQDKKGEVDWEQGWQWEAFTVDQS